MLKTNFKSRTERRNRLIGLLRSEEYWKTSELREHMGISQRTLMRELADLKEHGYPIESDRGRGGGVRLNGRWGIERLQLSHKEVAELLQIEESSSRGKLSRARKCFITLWTKMQLDGVSR